MYIIIIIVEFNSKQSNNNINIIKIIVKYDLKKIMII